MKISHGAEFPETFLMMSRITEFQTRPYQLLTTSSIPFFQGKQFPMKFQYSYVYTNLSYCMKTKILLIAPMTMTRQPKINPKHCLIRSLYKIPVLYVQLHMHYHTKTKYMMNIRGIIYLWKSKMNTTLGLLPNSSILCLKIKELI